MADKKVPVTPPKAPVLKVKTPAEKPVPMPGKPVTLMRINDSLDRTKKKN
jgi:hypothetical protein